MLTKREYEEIENTIKQGLDRGYAGLMLDAERYGAEKVLSLLKEHYTIDMQEEETKNDRFDYAGFVTDDGAGHRTITMAVGELLWRANNKEPKPSDKMKCNCPDEFEPDFVGDTKTVAQMCKEENDKPKKQNRITILEREVQDLKLRMDSVCRMLENEKQEKNKPKKPVDVTGTMRGTKCPNCGQKLTEVIDKYCNQCGQRIDWRD